MVFWGFLGLNNYGVLGVLIVCEYTGREGLLVAIPTPTLAEATVAAEWRDPGPRLGITTCLAPN